jgi:hypothetical protein
VRINHPLPAKIAIAKNRNIGKITIGRLFFSPLRPALLSIILAENEQTGAISVLNSIV